MSSREKYWLKVWNERHVFEPDPVTGKKKVFVTFPFPYMNAPVHVGTAFTAARVEFYARFKRLQGYNVLFPWAWHWTGQPIVGMSKRLKQGDASAVRRAFIELDGVPESEVEKFVDPEYLASYYTKVSRQGDEGHRLLHRLASGVQDHRPGLQKVRRVAVPPPAGAGLRRPGHPPGRLVPVRQEPHGRPRQDGWGRVYLRRSST